MWPMLERVGNPHQRLHVIHVAGTSGKTSTCYYLSSLLHTSGKKVGMSVSPHIFTVNERVQINTVPLDDAQFCHYLEKFDNLLGEYAKTQSYFEYMIMFALWVFVQEKVDYVVLETGLGGLLDSTNVVTRSDKVCVLTDIGYDHQHILGNTIEEIAAQKAGIIHEGNHVFCYEQSDKVMAVINRRVEQKKAKLHTVSNYQNTKDLQSGSYYIPSYQQRNFYLAQTAVRYVTERDDFAVAKIDPAHVVVPGRMQRVTYNGKQLILDGAHNPQKMGALVSSLQAMFPDRKFDIILAMKAAKDYQSAIERLRPIANKIVCTEFVDSDGKLTSVATHELHKTCQHIDIASVESDLSSALENTTSEPILVTGSLYFLSLFIDG